MNESKEKLVQLLAAYELIINALVFYASPDTYHAIAFFPDPPNGPFMDDFSEDHNDEFYNRAMPGARARAALRAWSETVHESE